MLIFSINMSNDATETDALMRTVFYCLEKIRRYRLSREGKLKVGADIVVNTICSIFGIIIAFIIVFDFSFSF